MRLSYDNLLQIFPSGPSRTARYGLAIVSSWGALIVCLPLERALSENLALTLFIIPVAVSAWYGGLGPGLLATLLCGLANQYILTEPNFSFTDFDMADWKRLTLFLITGGILTWLIETTRIARQRGEARAREDEQKRIEFEAQIAERERARVERERLIGA